MVVEWDVLERFLGRFWNLAAITFGVGSSSFWDVLERVLHEVGARERA